MKLIEICEVQNVEFKPNIMEICFEKVFHETIQIKQHIIKKEKIIIKLLKSTTCLNYLSQFTLYTLSKLSEFRNLRFNND